MDELRDINPCSRVPTKLLRDAASLKSMVYPSSRQTESADWEKGNIEQGGHEYSAVLGLAGHSISCEARGHLSGRVTAQGRIQRAVLL
jgi:hypothetical protein